MCDAAVGPRAPDRSRDVSVGDDVAELEARDEPPRVDLQRRPRKGEREIETAQTLLKIRAHLHGGFGEQRISAARARRPRAFEGRRDEARLVPLDREREPERRRQNDLPRVRLR